MRVALWTAVLCGGTVAWGQEPGAQVSSVNRAAAPGQVVAQESADRDGEKAVPAPTAASDTGGTVAEKEGSEQLAANDMAATASGETSVPLERHPTLLRMLFRNNQLRRSRGMWAHRLHPALARAAQDHANYMARTHDFNHYSNLGPTGRAYKYGFNGGVLENIAMGYGDIETTFYGWQSSGGHWANMTSNTTHAGFGYAVSRDGTPYWVAVYGNAPVIADEVQQASAEEPVDEAATEAASSVAQPASASPADSTAVADAGSTPAPAITTATYVSRPNYYSARNSSSRGRWLRRRR